MDKIIDANEMCEVAVDVNRSPLWNRIYDVVRQIPRQNVECDAMDAFSAANNIEQIVNNTAADQSRVIEELTAERDKLKAEVETMDRLYNALAKHHNRKCSCLGIY